MAGSVIDSLVVTLGLESKSFAQGIKGSTDQLSSFTRRLAGMFLAVRGIEDVVDYFKDLHHTLAEVGFESRNLGVMGTEMKRLGEVSELFGGQVGDAAESIQSLQASVFNLRYRGQISDSLIMLQRFGIAYLTATGHARNFRDVAFDAAKVIERQAQITGMDKGERYQMALSFGLTGGIASAVAQGTEGFTKAYQDASKDQKPLAERTIQAQTELAKQLIRQHEQMAAVNSNLLQRLTPAILKLTSKLQELIDKWIPLLIKAIDRIQAFFENPPGWFASLENALGPGGTLVAALLGVAAIFSAGGALVSALTSLPVMLGLLIGAFAAQLPSGGFLDKMDEWFLDHFGPGSSDAEKAAIRQHTEDPHARAGTIPRPAIAPPTPGAPRPAPAPASTGAAEPPTSMASGAGTQVHIDEINITTKDNANAIASGIGGALQRKLLVANSDGGQS